MKIERLFIYCLLAGTFLLASCSNENDVSDGNRLPEGQYPVTLTATGLGTTATTRTTADDLWDSGEAVAVKIGNEVKNYVTASYGKSTKLNAAEGVIPFYWQSTGDIKVSAWYLGTGYDNGTLPTKWSVQTNQNPDGYQKSDFLYAPQTDIDFKGTKPLTFYHQTAKVVVNIRNQGVVNHDDENIKSVTINAVTDGDFTTTLTKNCGLSAKAGVSPLEINFYKLMQPNTVSFDGVEETALASYKALVIPQAVSNTTIIINMKGYSPFKYTPTVPDQSGKWAGGTQYTYNLTIDGKEVKATVTTNDMTWTKGNSGGGTVEI